MSIGDFLEDFSPGVRRGTSAISEDEIESQKLDSFEKGYKAGWEDALKSLSEEQARISGDFARNLQDLSFTYHEAHAQVMQSMGPLLREIVDKILPVAMRETLGARIAEQLEELARKHGAQPMEIVTSPADMTAVNALLGEDFGFPVQAAVDDTLAEGQVFLRLAEEERQIDMASVLDTIRQGIDGLIDSTERELRHGQSGG